MARKDKKEPEKAFSKNGDCPHLMMVRFKKQIGLVAAVGLLLGIFVGLRCSCHREGSSFTRVNRLNRDCRLVVSFDIYRPLLIILGSTKEPAYEVIPEPNHFNTARILNTGRIPPTGIAVDPNGDRFYMATGREVAEYNVVGKLLRQTALEDFCCGNSNGSFSDLAEASESRLWLSVDNYPNGSSILAWDRKQKPATAEMGPSFLVARIDPLKEVAFITAKKSGIYNFRSGTFTEKPWAEYSFFDDVAEKGLLLSSVIASDRHDVISLIKPCSQQPIALSWGSKAQWGCDGYIYFFRYSMQLWRCNPEYGTPELVYSAHCSAKGSTVGNMHQLKFSRDRSLLAFAYRGLYDGAVRKCGLVLLDLKSREYIEIKPQYLTELCASAGYRSFVKSIRSGARDMLEVDSEFRWVTNMSWLEDGD